MSDDENSKLENLVSGLPKRVNLDETERRIGNTERSDTLLNLQIKEAQETYQRHTDATLAEDRHDAYNTFLNADTRAGLTSTDEYMLSKMPSADYTDPYPNPTEPPYPPSLDSENELPADYDGFTPTNINNINFEPMEENINLDSNKNEINDPAMEFNENADDILDVPTEENDVTDGGEGIKEVYDPTFEFNENADDISELPYDKNQESIDNIDPSVEFSENSDDITYNENNDMSDDYSENAVDITEVNEDTIEPDTHDHNYEPPMP